VHFNCIRPVSYHIRSITSIPVPGIPLLCPCIDLYLYLYLYLAILPHIHFESHCHCIPLYPAASCQLYAVCMRIYLAVSSCIQLYPAISHRIPPPPRLENRIWPKIHSRGGLKDTLRPPKPASLRDAGFAPPVVVLGCGFSSVLGPCVAL